MKKNRVALISLGCAKNQVDSEILLGYLREAGFIISDSVETADIALVNTCAFITAAKEEAIEEILAVARYKKSGSLKKLVVCGCLPQRYGPDLWRLLPEVDGFFGPGELAAAPQLLRRVLAGERSRVPAGEHFLYTDKTPRILLSPRHYAYVRIADGCDNRCHYCVIPRIRGGFRSRPVESVVAEVRQLAEQGVREINIISQDTTFYGYDLYRELSLPRLLHELCRVAGIEWIRILYTHPRHFTDELLACMAAESKICSYLDIPVQHCNDRILRLMGRNVTKRQMLRLLERVRRAIPGVALRTSLIVGFPQETDEMFKELCRFVREVAFERLGVFEYSPEEDTAAAGYEGQIAPALKHRRRKKIMDIQRTIVERHNKARVGKILPVLIDEYNPREHVAIGRTQCDAPDVDPVVFISPARCRPGRIVPVRITDFHEHDLVGAPA